jgi:hypothetical protein
VVLHPLTIPLGATRDGRIAILTLHGVPDAARPWVNTPPELFEHYLG